MTAVTKTFDLDDNIFYGIICGPECENYDQKKEAIARELTSMIHV